MTSDIEVISARIASAREEMSLVGVLRTATPTQAANYIENNVNSLADAKAALKLIVRLLIILRDQNENINA